MLANADPYCAAPRHLNMTVKKMMAKKYSEQAERLRESFAARYEPTDFSDKFLTGISLNHVFSKLNRQDLGDMNVVEEIISFVVRWDAERGFDGTEKMLEEARNTLLREISLKAEMRLAKIRMEVVNNGARGFCQETRRVRDSYIQNEDLTRQDAVDRVKSHIDAAMRCRVFNTPASRTQGTVKLENMKREGSRVVDTSQAWKQYARPSVPRDMCEPVVVPRTGGARGPLRGTPVVFHNVRDFRNDVGAMYTAKR